MKNKWLIIILLFSVTINLVAVGTLAFYWWQASRPGAFRARHEFPGPPPEVQQLNLSAEQREQIHQSQRQLFEQIHAFREVTQQHRTELFDLLIQDKIDTTKILVELDSLVQIQKQIQLQVMLNLLEQKKYLSTDQYRTFLKFFSRRFLNPYLQEMPPPNRPMFDPRARRDKSEWH